MVFRVRWELEMGFCFMRGPSKNNDILKTKEKVMIFENEGTVIQAGLHVYTSSFTLFSSLGSGGGCSI